MSAIDNTPENKNFLSPLGFKFTIKKAPHVNFFIQNVNIPSISITNVNVGNPFVKIPHSGEQMEFGDLQITFKVDEDMANYLELFNWIVSLGKPDNYTGYAALAAQPLISGLGISSDISLIILDSHKNSNMEIIYRDAFPISLGNLDFNTVDSSVDYISCTASFKYTLFSIDTI